MAGHATWWPTNDGCQLGEGQVCDWWLQGVDSARRPVFQQKQDDLSKQMVEKKHFRNRRMPKFKSFVILWWSEILTFAETGTASQPTNKAGLINYDLLSTKY